METGNLRSDDLSGRSHALIDERCSPRSGVRRLYYRNERDKTKIMSAFSRAKLHDQRFVIVLRGMTLMTIMLIDENAPRLRNLRERPDNIVVGVYDKRANRQEVMRDIQETYNIHFARGSQLPASYTEGVCQADRV